MLICVGICFGFSLVHLRIIGHTAPETANTSKSRIHVTHVGMNVSCCYECELLVCRPMWIVCSRLQHERVGKVSDVYNDQTLQWCYILPGNLIGILLGSDHRQLSFFQMWVWKCSKNTKGIIPTNEKAITIDAICKSVFSAKKKKIMEIL